MVGRSYSRLWFASVMAPAIVITGKYFGSGGSILNFNMPEVKSSIDNNTNNYNGLGFFLLLKQKLNTYSPFPEPEPDWRVKILLILILILMF